MNRIFKTFIKRLIPSNVTNFYVLWKNKPFPMNWTDEEREVVLAGLYQKKTKRVLDWNNLNLFTEKLQWYKLYYSHHDLGKIVDKVSFKQYIEIKLGQGNTIPILGAWSRVEDIPWGKLPQTFVMKSNCQGDGKCIRFIKDKNKENIEVLKKDLKDWLKPENSLINSFCRAYYDVTPMILAEEYKENIADNLYDYKIFCFSGNPECVYAATDHFTEAGSNICFYNFNWKKLDIKYGSHSNIKDIPKPIHLDEMIRIAESLSKDFPFVRVDFFDTAEKLYLAEMTFYPGGGFSSYPLSVDSEWGKKFILPPKIPNGRKIRTDLNYNWNVDSP